MVHSCRHRFAFVPGDPALDFIEQQLAACPAITAPTITLDGDTDGVSPGSSVSHAQHFPGCYQHRIVQGDHNLPQENPTAFAQAILDLAILDVAHPDVAHPDVAVLDAGRA